MRLSARCLLVPLILCAASWAWTQNAAEEIKALMASTTVAWDACDNEALEKTSHDPMVACFGPGQVANREAVTAILEERGPQPGTETLGEYQPEVYGDVAICIAPNRIEANEEQGRPAFEKTRIAVVWLRTEDGWKAVSFCNLWDPEEVAERVPEAQSAQIKELHQASMATLGAQEAEFDAVAETGALDWDRFAGLCHDECVVMGPIGDGDSMLALRLADAPDIGGVPALAFTTRTDPEVESGLGALVNRYDADVSFDGEDAIPCHVVDIRCYMPEENTWRYVFAAVVPREQ